MKTEALPKTFLPFVWLFIKKQPWRFSLCQIGALAWSLDMTLWPYILGWVVDKITHYGADKTHMWRDFMPVFFVMAGLWLAIEGLFRLSGFLYATTYPRFEAQIRMCMYDYVQGHSYRFFSNQLAGTIANRISDMPESAQRMLMHTQALFIPSLVALVIALAIFFTMNAGFAILLLAWVLIHMGICFATAPRCSRLSHQHSDSRSVLSGKIVDAFTNIINVKSFARQAFEFNHIQGYQTDEQTKNQKALVFIEKLRIVLGLTCLILPGVLLTWWMFYSWQRHMITVGDFVVIFYVSGNIINLAWMSGMELPNFFKDLGVCRQAMTVIQAEHDLTDREDAKPLLVTNGKIEYQHMAFHYSQKKIVFDDVNLTIPGGQKVGLVGYSGGGKSSFVNLLMRYFDVEAGNILIDDQELRTVTRQSLRENISMIPQDPTLFHRSIIDNIRYGNPDANFEEVIQAAKKSHSHEFITQMAQGYDSLVGERGVKLSGGQRQRIAIARAILKDAPLLILDEATSALDSVTEKYIQDSLHRFMSDRTTIVIAHRLSTLSEMDRILVFDQGKIIEDGSHDELLTLRGHYARMWAMQAGGFLPEKPD